MVRFNPPDEAKLLALGGDFIDDPTPPTSSVEVSFAD